MVCEWSFSPVIDDPRVGHENANGCRIPLPYGKTERQSFITRPISGVLYSIDIGEWHAHGDKKLP
ncbi:hypothetical protein VSX64_01680 [Aurantimonas sp. C2-6-R+9]|uniref:hypothetical protein n=1 Tax=unclassified Aurantimonas TaxID=2638230 RepID=UPI002E177B5B|nr:MULTISPECIES: hypothetical protein [unclassified Aurantimonas]MEC5289635.1 hypothetical protein [Aurantimonas sp. C2-3-R2]MEC5379599.1 hypothetical protein [Aurantimonas sp. C2-6-R+9]MEC5410716.1 hypothetical protein [Aurantimonas sp. C2-4-R8]